MIQTWALEYWLRMARRQQIDDTDAELEFHEKILCFHLNPDRYNQLYYTGGDGDQGNAFGAGVPEMPVTDTSDLDSWFAGLGNQRGMSGAEAERIFGGGMGQGRRV